MPTFELFAPSVCMAFDLFSLQRSLFGFIGSLFLPVILVVILANAMGGNAQSVADALCDVLASVVAISMEILLRLGKTFFLGFIYVISALMRIALSWNDNRKIKLKTGPEPGNGSTGTKRSGNRSSADRRGEGGG